VALGCSDVALGCPVGRLSLGETAECDTPLPARSGNVALHLARGRGSPPLPLRFDPGTPFLDQHNTNVYWRGQMQSGERERAGSSQLMDGTRTTRALIGKLRFVAEVATGECRCSESRGSINDDRGDGGWRARAVGGERERRFQAGQTTRPGPRRGVRVAASPSSPLGRLLRRSTPWRGASLPPGAGEPDRTCWKRGGTHARNRLARRARCSAF